MASWQILYAAGLCTPAECSEIFKKKNTTSFLTFVYFFSDFLAQIDVDGNSLTLHSTLKDLVKHTSKGLDLLSEIKDNANNA